MSIVTGSSLASIGIQGINQASRDLTKTFTQLASGRRIVSAADDAAGLALSSSIDTRLRILEKASETLSYSSSVVQTADGTAQQVQDITGRLAELAVQAANGTYSADQRAAMQAEFTGLTDELQRIGEAAGDPQLIALDNFSASGEAASAGFTTVAVGGFFYQEALADVQSVSLASPESSRAGLEAIDQLSQDVAQYRGEVIGTTQSRIDSIQQGIAQELQAGAESLSRITDVDVAEAMVTLLQSRIRFQSNAKLFAIGRSLDTEFMRALLS